MILHLINKTATRIIRSWMGWRSSRRKVVGQ